MSDLRSRLTTGVSSIRRRVNNGLFPDDRAVSPIVATIILIALVVVMGGVVASVVFGFGSGTQQTPHAKFNFKYQKGATQASGAGIVYVRDTGGPKLTPSNTLNLTVKDTTQHWAKPGHVNNTHSVKAGTTLEIGTKGSHKIRGGDHIVVDWTGPNGKSTSTLAKFNVPK